MSIETEQKLSELVSSAAQDVSALLRGAVEDADAALRLQEPQVPLDHLRARRALEEGDVVEFAEAEHFRLGEWADGELVYRHGY